MDDERIKAAKQLQHYLESLLPSLTPDTRLIHSSSRQFHARYEMDGAIIGVEGAVQQVLAALRRERNAMLPVSYLPAEILAKVLSYGTLADTLSASWVSRAWRVAAINTPSLWTCLDLEAYPNNNFRALQLDRCGALPLELNLPIVKDLRSVLQPQTPYKGLLSRSYSISNLLNLGVLEGIDASRLQSLHLFSDAADLMPSRISVATPALRHLCMDMRSCELNHMAISINLLHTLHLYIRSAKADVVLKRLSGLPRLQELLIQWPPDGPDEEPMDIISRDILTEHNGLQRIYLIEPPKDFLSRFLAHFRPASHTNLYIAPCHLISNGILAHLRHQIATHTLWMDPHLCSFTFDHGTSVTKIMDTHVESTSFRGLPDPVGLGNLTSIIINSGPPPTSRDLRILTKLTKFSFTFEPAPLGVQQSPLADTLNEELVKSCPHLQELALVLRKPLSTNFFVKDQALETVLSFLEAWLLEYEVVFGTVRISDRVKPQRWSSQLDVLSSITWLFELRDIDLASQAPEFPVPRRFVPQRPPLRWRLPAPMLAPLDNFVNLDR
ncbi:SubName: Full=Uncharacterized protein {ECO:0000313/EMBL:CCA76279.1} [Serendipita indica DSM 11827]|nr:SubName: Full=Uncharacterized protein {ECO:0000313/EMBL:CCA76279.1} [Serendipita indica DSM 11827]